MAGKYWTQAWNPVTGCTPVSPGCERCWAEAMSRRFHSCPVCKGSGVGPSPMHPSGFFPNPRERSCIVCGGKPQHFTPTFHPDRLDAPLHWRKPRRVFVCNMGDLFHEAITNEQIHEVILRTIQAHQHIYLILTKRPKRMRSFFIWLRDEYEFVPSNLHLGVTVCNQEEADRNVPILLDTPAAKRWVSIEPMLGAVDLDQSWVSYLEGWKTEPEHSPGCTIGCCDYDCPIPVQVETPQLDWVILGGETGPGARPMQPEWALDVYRQCEAAGVPFYWKQRGSAWEQSTGWGRQETCDMQATHELPAALAGAVRT